MAGGAAWSGGPAAPLKRRDGSGRFAGVLDLYLVRTPAVSVVHADALAHQVNTKIREIAERFASYGIEDQPLSLLCECGCLRLVTSATLNEYEALAGRPLLLQGHALPASQIAAD